MEFILDFFEDLEFLVVFGRYGRKIKVLKWKEDYYYLIVLTKRVYNFD